MPICTALPDCGREAVKGSGLCAGHRAQYYRGKPFTPLRGRHGAITPDGPGVKVWTVIPPTLVKALRHKGPTLAEALRRALEEWHRSRP